MVEGQVVSQVPRSGTLVHMHSSFSVATASTVYSNTNINSSSHLSFFGVCFRIFICVNKDQSAVKIHLCLKKSQRIFK